MAAARRAEWELVVEEQVQKYAWTTMGIKRRWAEWLFLLRPMQAIMVFQRLRLLRRRKERKYSFAASPLNWNSELLFRMTQTFSNEILWIPFVVDKSHGAANWKNLWL
jgi:hypothetical protein